MDADLVPTRRFEARPSLGWRGECSIGNKTWRGTVHDLTGGGAFFQPELCVTDGERLYPEDAWMVAGGAESVELRLSDERMGTVFRGTVRWSGCSDIHRCSGIGLSFEG